MIEEYKLKDGRTVIIKYLLIKDYETNNNYEFVHNWLRNVSKFLAKNFNEEDLKKDKKGLYWVLSNDKSSIFIGAIYKGKIIASSDLRIDPFKEKELHIASWGIAIHPDFQNQGLGTRLLILLERIACEKGIKKLEAEYFDGNKNAEILYIEKMHYTIEGRKKFAGLLSDGTFVDKILIGKILDKSLM